MPRAAFTTLGCKVNQYETQRILDSFLEAGFDVVAFDQEADVYVINTCSVTGQAEAKSRNTVRRARRLNPDAKVVATGCAAQMDLNEGRATLDADLVVPNPEKLQAVEHVLTRFPLLAEAARANRQAETPAADGRAKRRTRATLKVQDGCDVLCSYCSIPFTRPGLVSRPWREVLDEARRLVDLGYREAVLTGVLIGAYGPESGSGGPCFDELVQILAERSGLDRLRISSIEMHQVTPPIIDLAKAGVVCPHFHIPLQCGDSDVLRDMNRRYDKDEYLALCDDLRRTVPGVTLTTDVMVGFPTETAERFANSLETVRRAGYYKAHVFRFSPRPGTPADAWGDPVDPNEKHRRSLALAEVVAESGRAHVARFLGQKVRVLVEGKTPRNGLLEGLSDNYLSVQFAGPPEVRGTCQWVRLERQEGLMLEGELVGDASPFISVRA
ncbi:MAG: tRNA (N(6)-L-threonylcarbamoyladenosine(37)-C(2))-methylthiotransferase MtaB [Fimbriimonadaceae bacterium]|nr:tRNA (N(6)-L-threonylcarbamoyladenosine(37)-C(2))-methylthiotransferase MtaB [Fimbriimonadaceae bacterium]QYK56042.1 MAG: tRNA (N(6)-L-threonylcarbamoyladenosine(37)-C(2))-methylthiotransferase MtaB [Fimbriimonadaceae bacterium]